MIEMQNRYMTSIHKFFWKKALFFLKFELLLTCLEGHGKCQLFALLADSNVECHTDDHNEIEFSSS